MIFWLYLYIILTLFLFEENDNIKFQYPNLMWILCQSFHKPLSFVSHSTLSQLTSLMWIYFKTWKIDTVNKISVSLIQPKVLNPIIYQSVWNMHKFYFPQLLFFWWISISIPNKETTQLYVQFPQALEKYCRCLFMMI